MNTHVICLALAVPALVREVSIESPGARAVDHSESSSANHVAEVARGLERAEYAFCAVDRETRTARNRAHDLCSRVVRDGIEVVPRTDPEASEAPWHLFLHTRAFGSTSKVEPVDEPLVDAAGERVELRHDRFTEWYVNDPSGIEQGWTIPAPPCGPEQARIRIEIEATGLVSTVDPDGTAVSFADPSGVIRLRYQGLRACDARSDELCSRIVAWEPGFAIEVEAADAHYPITIDPVLVGPAWTWEVNQTNAQLGYSVSDAGDVNGDGFDDVIVGAYLFDGGQTDEGGAWLFLGSAMGLSPTPSWNAEGNQTLAWFGFSVASAGDVNGDGFGDVIVGAPNFTAGESQEGRAYVYLGSSSGLSPTAAWISESNQVLATFGASVSGAGDVDGDGLDDVVVGATYFDGDLSDEGAAFVFLGTPSGTAATPVWRAEGDQTGCLFGRSVASAGDVDGDGFDDVLVAAPRFDHGESDEGRAYLFSGSATGPSASASWTFESDQVGAEVGIAACAGDVDADGFDDVIIGAWAFDGSFVDEGRAYVFMGATTGLSATPSWATLGGQAYAQHGVSVAGAGDVDGDGFDDVIVGANRFSGDLFDEGRAVCFLGSPSGLSVTPAWSAEGDVDNAAFGRSVSGAGDVDGDGFDDVIVGANLVTSPHVGEGRAYLYLGQGPAVAAFCFGDGTGSACPCGNGGGPSSGCASSVNALGASLAGNGSASIAADTLTLVGSGMPDGSALYFQGTARVNAGAGSAFGDGLRCAGGTIVRLGTRSNVGGASQYPSAGDAPISIRGGNSHGDFRTYQVWYRNAASFCTAATFNLTNGIAVHWSP